MIYLSKEDDINQAKEFLKEAIQEAKKATCHRSKCGSIIVSNNKEIIGKGFNCPPNKLESQRRCNLSKDSYNKKVTDKTCCIHAEQNAIIDALKNNSEKLANSRLYFSRLDINNRFCVSGEPYCTICSKMALHCGISEFVLWKKYGICVYNTKDYNKISYDFNNQ